MFTPCFVLWLFLGLFSKRSALGFVVRILMAALCFASQYHIFEILCQLVQLPETPSQNVVLALIALSLLHSHIPTAFIAEFEHHEVVTEPEFGGEVSPLDTASFFSTYTFWWIRPTLRTANEQSALAAADLPALSRADNPTLLQHRFSVWWKRNAATCTPFGMLVGTAFMIQSGTFWYSYLHGLLFLTCMFMDPILLSMLLNTTDSMATSLALVVCLSVSMLVRVSCMEVCFFHSTRVANNIRTALTASIFKATVHGPSNASAINTGKLSNLLATDADRLGQFSYGIFFLAQWSFAVVSLPFVIYFIFQLVGPGAFLGLFAFLLSTSFSRWIGWVMAAAQKKLQECKDSRSKIVNQVIRSAKVTHLESLQSTWHEKLTQARAKELKQLKTVQYLSAFNSLAGALFSLTVPLSMFISVTVLEGKELDAATAFTALAWIAQMQWSISSIPTIFNIWSFLQPSLERISEYLREASSVQWQRDTCSNPEHHFQEIHLQCRKKGKQDFGDSQEVVSLDVQAGQLVVVIGVTGSGKSRLLSSFISPKKELGDVGCAHGSVALVLQTPFLLNASIKDNILFGLPCDQRKMDDCLSRTELVPDLEALPNGLSTMARICLARAVYADADCYLLDDILSAVDRTTGHQIWLNVVAYLKSRGKTVILITHQMQYLSNPEIDQVVLMDDGEIKALGRFADLAHDTHVARCIEIMKQERRTEEGDLSQRVSETANGPPSDDIVDPRIPLSEFRNYLEDVLEPLTGKYLTRNVIRDQVLHHFLPSSSQTSEISQTGSVSWKDFQFYLNHFRSGGRMVLIAFIYVFVNMCSSVWVTYWTDSGSKEGHYSQLFYLAIFGAFGCLEAVVACAQAILLFLSAVGASTSIHEEMAAKLLSVPLTFFDTHSSGLIMNRFLQDLGSIDSSVPQVILDTTTKTFSVLLQFCLIFFITPYVGFVLPFAALFYAFIVNTFRTAARDSRRIESAARGPVYDLYGDILSGLESIQCFGAQTRFEEWNCRLVESMAKAKVGNEAVNKWAQALTVQVSSLFYFGSGLVGVVLLYQNIISLSSFGLVLMYSGTLQRVLMDYVMGLTNLETNFVSVERIAAFLKIRSDQHDRLWIPPNWPQEGELSVENLRLRYAINRNEALQGVSFVVPPCSKVAVIGRTGCGKSSLMAALAQLYQPISGKILIDGCDIGTISKQALRKVMRVIPQETVILDGTIRENILLGGKTEDHEIWTLLDLVGLKQKVSNLGGLDADVTFHGTEFSSGEKQLLCLVRSLAMGSPKILICDEVTANVDLATDWQILDSLLRLPSTVIMVMHRLENLRKFDKILMLDGGNVVAYGNGDELLSRNSDVQEFVRRKPTLVKGQ